MIRQRVLADLVDVIQQQKRLHFHDMSFEKPEDRRLYHHLTWGVLRHHHGLDKVLKPYLQKPLAPKDKAIQLLLMLGAFQLLAMRIPVHAVVDETVNAVPNKQKWARGLVNAVLKRLHKDIEAGKWTAWNDCQTRTLPDSFDARIRQVYGGVAADKVNQIYRAQPALCVRALPPYSEQEGLTPHPTVRGAYLVDPSLDFTTLTGFKEGGIFAQDASSQWAAQLLPVQADACILDACSAPGGKGIALWQSLGGKCDLWMADKDPKRWVRLKENLNRAGVKCSKWMDSVETLPSALMFDAILLDAPCSGSGTFRRHPDNPRLSHAPALPDLQKTQQDLLLFCLSRLKPGGHLLYSTCSLFPEENDEVIAHALESPDAHCKLVPLSIPGALPQAYGQQLLPGEYQDGMYYALLSRD